MKNKIWWILLPVLAASLIGWGAWATVAATDATPREVFDKHVQSSDEKFERVQKSIDEKVQKLIDHLIGE